MSLPKKNQTVSDFLLTLGPTFFKLGFDFARIHFLSVDKKAIVCQAKYKHGQSHELSEKIRLKIEENPYIKTVINDKQVKKWNYLKDIETMGPDPDRERLGKSNVNCWVEAPLINIDTDEVYGLLCLFSLKNELVTDTKLVVKISHVANDISRTLCRIKNREEAKLKEKLINTLVEIDNELLYETQSVSPLEQWKISSTYQKCADLLQRLTKSDIVHIRKKDGNELVPLTYSGNIVVSDNPINLSDETHNIFLSSQVVRENKPIFRIGKIRDEEITSISSLHNYNLESVDILRKVRSSACVPVKVKRKVIGTIYVSSFDFDFLNDANKLIISDFSKKISLIMSIEHNISNLARKAYESYKKVSEQRDLIEKRMRFAIRQEIGSGFLHGFKNSIGESMLAVKSLRKNFDSDKYILKKKSIIDPFETIEQNIIAMANISEAYSKTKYAPGRSGGRS